MHFVITAIDIGLLAVVFSNKSLLATKNVLTDNSCSTSSVGLGFPKTLSRHMQIVFATREVVDGCARLSLQTRENEARYLRQLTGIRASCCQHCKVT
jgi:hypothetical protein